MICLDDTDVIEGGASVDAVVDYQIHGLVGTTFTQLAAGVMGTTLTTVLYTAGAAISVVSIILVNKHTSAVNITLCLDPADGGNPRYLIPKTVSLGIGYSLHTDGTKFGIYNAKGELQTSGGVSASSFNADGEILVGTGAGTYQAESGATARESLGAMALTGDNLAIGSDADGDIYYRASSVLARLAKGAANTKLFMNAGATAPEWANGVYIGTTTYDTSTASGTQNITGVGFKPSKIILLTVVDSAPEASIGFDDGTSHRCIANQGCVAAGNWTDYANNSIFLYQTDGTVFVIGYVSALGADGFTITWAKTGAKTGTAHIHYIAFR